MTQSPDGPSPYAPFGSQPHGGQPYGQTPSGSQPYGQTPEPALLQAPPYGPGVEALFPPPTSPPTTHQPHVAAARRRPARRTGRGVAHAVGAGVLAGAVAIGAFVVLSRKDEGGTATATAASATPASATPSGLIDGQRINQVELKVGDCVRSATSDGVGDLSVVPCTESHIGEVTGVYELAAKGAYPGENAVVADAEKRCEGFVPSSPSESVLQDLEIYFIYPREATWAVGDREVQCLVVAEKPLTKRLADL